MKAPTATIRNASREFPELVADRILNSDPGTKVAALLRTWGIIDEQRFQKLLLDPWVEAEKFEKGNKDNECD